MMKQKAVRALKLLRGIKRRAKAIASHDKRESNGSPVMSIVNSNNGVHGNDENTNINYTDVEGSISTERDIEWRSMFDAFDKDHSGSISIPELVDMLHAMRVCDEKSDAEAIVQSIDVDNSRDISYTEFVSWASQNLVPDESETKDENIEEMVDVLFSMIDSDGSGLISHDEFRSTMKSLNIEMTDADTQAIINAVDANNDGVLHKDEFKALLFTDLKTNKH